MKRYLIRVLLSLFLMALAPLCPEVQAAPGDYLFQWGAPHLLTDPGGVAVDSAGTAYVTENENHRIRVFDSKGNVIRTWGSFGSGTGQFSYPQGVALSGNLVYVADTGNSRIEVFDTSGNFVRTWGSYGSGHSNLNYPTAVAVGSNGRVFVADAGNEVVKIFDVNGNFLHVIGEVPDFGGKLYGPDIALDASNNVWIVDLNNVSLFDSDGNGIKGWPNGVNFVYYQGVAVGSSGNLNLSVSSNPLTTDAFKIHILDTSGNLLKEWGSLGSGPGQFDQICDVATDSSGNVYVAEVGNNRVQVFNSGGTYLRKVGGTDGDGQFNFPQGVAVDSVGNVVVADQQNHRMQVFDSNGKFLRKFSAPGSTAGQYSNPTAVAVDGAGNLYVTDVVENNVPKIEVFDSSGKFLRSWNWPQYSIDLGVPGGIAVAANGNVYVANAGHCQILVFNNSGSQIASWGSCGTGNGMFYDPFGLALDGSGNLYVADRDNHRIQVLSSSGTFLRSWGSQGGGDGQFYNPTWVAVDGAGNVYVTDIDEGGNSRIEVFDSTGKFLGKWGSHGSGNGQFLTPAGVAASLSGATAYVVDTDNHRVEAFVGYGDQLPQGWIGRDVGSVGVKGQASFANGTFTVRGSGADIYGTADAFHYVFRPLSGDGQIIARVTAVQNTNTYAKGGVMIRQSLAANSPHAMVDIMAAAGAEFSRRSTAGGSTTVTNSAGIAAPYWVKLVRSGSTFSGYISKDGTSWTLLGSSTIGMTGTVYVGLVGNSHVTSVLGTTTIDSVSLSGQTNTPTVAITAPAAGATYNAPATVQVTASATATTGSTVQKVEFYAGTVFIGTATGAPYGVTWNNVAAGSYSLTAKVTDLLGATATSAPVLITVNGAGLPAPWTTQDVGSVGVAGSASYLNGTFTLKGAGADIYGTADAFRFVYQPMTGNGQIIARVASLQNTNSYAKAGVMIRQSLAANSMHATMDFRPAGTAEFLRRSTTGGTTSSTSRSGQSLPYWVKLVRNGNTFTGSISSDGVNWVQVGSSTIYMSGTVYVGLIANSHANSVLTTATFDRVSTTVDTTAPTVTAFTVPATSASLTVPITTLTASDNVGVTGYLVNESATKPAATASGWSATKPASYIFTGSGAKTLYAWAKDAAGNVSNSRSATVTVSSGALPAPWLTQDIGSVGLAGSAGYLNGIFTLRGAGADIWGTADAFRFVYKVMNGNGQIIARVASVQNTNTYAKSGVMMRQSLTANSPHATMDIRPTGSAEFLRRTTTGGTTSNTGRSGVSAPYWVKLVRSGNIFTGSVSSDGVTWVQVGSTTISMSSSIYVGLIVNSHNTSVLCTTTIDGVK